MMIDILIENSLLTASSKKNNKKERKKNKRITISLWIE